MSLYPQTPIEALQCKLAAIHGVTTMRRTGARLGGDATNLAAYERALRQADLFLWAGHTAEQVRAAAVSYPLPDADTYHEDWSRMPRLSHALMTFDAPVFDRSMGQSGQPFEGLSALLVFPATTPTPAGDVEHYRFVGLVWGGGADAIPTFVAPWPVPGEGHDDDRLTGETLMRFMLTASAFVEQQIVVEREADISRAQSKLARKVAISPVVKTVRLRARQQETRATPGERPRTEFSCRWIVQGHWRQQPYPKQGIIRPKFIEAYLKGPDDQPLKTPVPDVFVVNR